MITWMKSPCVPLVGAACSEVSVDAKTYKCSIEESLSL